MLIATALLLAAPLAQSDTPDLVVLDDGKEIECRVLFEGDNTVVYTKKRKAEEIARSQVRSVRSIERSLRETLERFDQIERGDVTALLELAAFCESRELFGEARHLLIRVVLLDEANETAWTKLGGSFNERRGWRLKVRGRFYTLEQLRERVADWKNAMELPTAHFLLKTDISPERAIDLAIDLERAYLTFYDLLGGVLRLYPFDEIPEVHLYAGADNYPAPPNPGDLAWFAPLANILYVNASQASEAPQTAVAFLTDTLLWNAFRRTVGKTGSVPAWARDGIAQAFGGAYRSNPGHATWDLSQPILAYFELQAQAEKTLSLSDIINAGFRARTSGTNAQMYTAQSYTLTHFLAHADGGIYREAFGRYLVGAFVGKAATTHLEQALDMQAKEIEERWLAHVKATAAG